jgi:hypothetical protein
MAYLPRHVEGLRPWLELAAEVVVVDSHSTDGTMDYLRANLKHPALRSTSHPPGLYASWNHGIAQIQSRYVYLATTGDTISREGICKLVETADSLGCDVVISKPTFCDSMGGVLPDISWPIDDIITTLNVTQPRKLHQLEAVIFATVLANGALTSSCASSLFRTEILQRFPFPTDFGTAGDAAWSVQHAAEVCWAVLAEKFSTFLVHPTNASADEKRTFADARRMDVVMREAVQTWCHNRTIREENLASIGWSGLFEALTGYLDAKSRFDQLRRAGLPWSLNPVAWITRARRNQCFGRLQELKRTALAAVQTQKSPFPPAATG